MVLLEKFGINRSYYKDIKPGCPDSDLRNVILCDGESLI